VRHFEVAGSSIEINLRVISREIFAQHEPLESFTIKVSKVFEFYEFLLSQLVSEILERHSGNGPITLEQRDRFSPRHHITDDLSSTIFVTTFQESTAMIPCLIIIISILL